MMPGLGTARTLLFGRLPQDHGRGARGRSQQAEHGRQTSEEKTDPGEHGAINISLAGDRQGIGWATPTREIRIAGGFVEGAECHRCPFLLEAPMSAARLTFAVLAALAFHAAPASAQDTTMMMKKDSMPMKGMDQMMNKDSMPMKGMDHGMMKDSSMKGMGMGMGMDHGMMHPMFTGRHDHKVSGSYTILDRDGGKSLALGADFSLDGAPDPYVVLSADEMGTGSGTLVLGRLKKKSGASVFPIPAGTDLGRYSHVLIWCKKFNVTLGEAQLASSSMMMHQ
jgi:hypothetical protein